MNFSGKQNLTVLQLAYLKQTMIMRKMKTTHSGKSFLFMNRERDREIKKKREKERKKSAFKSLPDPFKRMFL